MKIFNAILVIGIFVLTLQLLALGASADNKIKQRYVYEAFSEAYEFCKVYEQPILSACTTNVRIVHMLNRNKHMKNSAYNLYLSELRRIYP